MFSPVTRRCLMIEASSRELHGRSTATDGGVETLFWACVAVSSRSRSPLHSHGAGAGLNCLSPPPVCFLRRFFRANQKDVWLFKHNAQSSYLQGMHNDVCLRCSPVHSSPPLIATSFFRFRPPAVTTTLASSCTNPTVQREESSGKHPPRCAVARAS